MLHFQDIKVISANVVCMFVLSLQNLNALLQSVLFLATIAYTIIRLLNEVKNGKARNSESANTEKQVENEGRSS